MRWLWCEYISWVLPAFYCMPTQTPDQPIARASQMGRRKGKIILDSDNNAMIDISSEAPFWLWISVALSCKS